MSFQTCMCLALLVVSYAADTSRVLLPNPYADDVSYFQYANVIPVGLYSKNDPFSKSPMPSSIQTEFQKHNLYPNQPNNNGNSQNTIFNQEDMPKTNIFLNYLARPMQGQYQGQIIEPSYINSYFNPKKVNFYYPINGQSTYPKNRNNPSQGTSNSKNAYQNNYPTTQYGQNPSQKNYPSQSSYPSQNSPSQTNYPSQTGYPNQNSPSLTNYPSPSIYPSPNNYKNNQNYDNNAAAGLGQYPCNSKYQGRTYSVVGLCYAYYECINNESLYRECSDNYRFDVNYGKCVQDNTCRGAVHN